MFDLEPSDALALSLHHNPGVYALLVGSGLSRAAGIPTGWEITLDLIRKVGALNGVAEQNNWAAWFKQKYGTEPSYSELLDKLAATPSERRAILHQYIEPQEREETRRPTKAHHAIAKLVADGSVRVVITTNFDRLIENALREAGIEPTVVASEDAVSGATPLVHSRCTVIKLHGDYLDTRIKNTDAELGSYAPAIDSLLDEVFDRFGVVVVGWSGEWDMALRAALKRAPNRRYALYWVARAGVRPLGQDIISLRGGQVVSASDADAFFARLSNSVEALRQAERPHPLSVQMAVALAKRYCRDDRFALEWSELLAGEVAKIRDYATGKDYPTASPTNELANVVVGDFVARSEILRQLCLISGRWGTAEANTAAARAIRSLSFQYGPLGGFSFWNDLRDFGATLCFYWALAGALAREDLKIVAGFMHAKVRTQTGERPFVMELPALALGSSDWKFLTGLEGKKYPASEFLFGLLGKEVHNIALAGEDIEELFDRLEFLVSMECAHQRLHTDKHFWFPAGRYMYKRGGDAVFERLAALDNLSPDAAVLRAGLLGGDPESAAAAVKAVREFIKANSWLRW